MKKLLIILCFASVSYSIAAQASKDPKKKKIEFMFAPFAGLTLADLRGEGESGDKPILGVLLGVGAKVLSLSEDWGIRTELAYSQQGSKSNYGEGSYSSKTETRLSYLNLPILAHFQHESGFFAEAGLQPGLLLSAKQKRTSSSMGGGNTTNEDIKEDLNSFDVGLPVGAGFVFKKKVAVSARVAPGLMNIIENDNSPKRKNFVLSAKVSYIL